MPPRISLERAEYARFQQLYEEGHFGTCRYGQAFHNHFDLWKMKDHHFDGLYEATDQALAKVIIDKYFELT